MTRHMMVILKYFIYQFIINHFIKEIEPIQNNKEAKTLCKVENSIDNQYYFILKFLNNMIQCI